ncbi:MAG: M15 family metallopeptidase [Chlorobium sp.]
MGIRQATEAITPLLVQQIMKRGLNSNPQEVNEMVNSRKIKDLHPHVATLCQRFLDECSAAGYDVLITSTYRDNESQAELYAQGRTKPGRIVTNAQAGKSWHNWRVAFDIVPLRHGKPVWGTLGNGIDNNPKDDEIDDLELWHQVAAIAKSVGLEWAGDWKTFRELAHFQYTGGLTLADFASGKIFVV